MVGTLRELVLLVLLVSIITPTLGKSLIPQKSCRKTKVAVLGAGTAGITAAVRNISVKWDPIAHRTYSKHYQTLLFRIL